MMETREPILKYKGYEEINDGRQDLMLRIGGVTIIHFPQEGYQSLGISYEQAKELLAGILVALFDSEKINDKKNS
jgi:hypothetical protein